MVKLAKLFTIGKGSLRVFSLLMALFISGYIFWDPTLFMAKIANYSQLLGPICVGILVIWSVCTGAIYGIGYKPRHTIWRIIVLPWPALLIMLAIIFALIR